MLAPGRASSQKPCKYDAAWVCATCRGIWGRLFGVASQGIPLEGTMEELKKGISRRNLLKGATLLPLAWRRSACLAAARRAAVELEQQV